MDQDLQQIFEKKGINLANYYIEKITPESIVYVHKRFLEGRKQKVNKIKEEKKNKKEKKIKEKKTNKVDKSQQFDGIFSKVETKGRNNDSVLEQTMQFARNIAPLVLPSGKERSPSPVYYTVTASKKYKKKTPKPTNLDQNVTYKREQCKKIIESFRNDKIGQKESLSVRETISLSSNTLDEIQLNPSLCCSLSDISEKQKIRHEKKHKRDLQNFVASESFNAMATEMLNKGDSKIKVHLMNESDKNMLAENIRAPIMNAIKECIEELKSVSELNKEVVIVTTIMKTNSQKLENITERLASIEKRLDDHINSVKTDQSRHKTPSPKVHKPKASTLELLSEDIVHISEASDKDEQEIISARKRARAKSAVVQLTPRKTEKEIEMSACGEATANLLSMSAQMGAKPNRIPARFCWTDAGRKNMN